MWVQEPYSAGHNFECSLRARMYHDNVYAAVGKESGKPSAYRACDVSSSRLELGSMVLQGANALERSSWMISHVVW